MRSIIAGILLAAGLAAGAAFVLDSAVQRPVADKYSTEAVRL